MTDIQPDTGMGPETPATSTRSNRRTRRLAIVGALALVLVAGALLVGVKTTGGGSGAIYSGATCATGGVCNVGDIGPGTGTVFFVAPADFACGANTCRYLEAAPYGWRSAGSADPAPQTWDIATSIATGGSAGSKADWRLPTNVELNNLWLYVKTANATVNVSPKVYWSSTVVTANSYYDSQDLKSGTVYEDFYNTVDFVRPVRAF